MKKTLSETRFSSIDELLTTLKVAGTKNPPAEVVQAAKRFSLAHFSASNFSTSIEIASRFAPYFAKENCSTDWILTSAVNWANDPGEAYAARRIADWADMIGADCFTPTIAGKVALRISRLLPLFGNQKLGSLLRPVLDHWNLRKTIRSKTIAGEKDYPAELRRWIRRIGHYQEQAGQPVEVPQRIQSVIAMDLKRAKEISYLGQKVAENAATTGMRNRLEHLLQQGDTSQRLNIRRAVRMAKENFLLISLEALEVLVDTAAKQWLQQFHLNPHRFQPFCSATTVACWCHNMDPGQRANLKSTLTLSAQHGSQYKWHIGGNQAWIRSAEKRGLDVRYWMRTNRRTFMVEGQTISLELETDPYEIYLMGARFLTCLSPGDCNEMAVLTNASDANKRVLFVRNADGRVIGRKLIAITEDYQLVGFYLYLIAGLEKELSTAIEKEVHRYGKRLAAALRSQLIDSDKDYSVANLKRRFWYDDGAVDWDQ